MSAEFEIVTTRDGQAVVRDLANGELMHPVGPQLEARSVYADPARLAERMQEGPLTIFDVGLGAGSNALEAWRRSEARTCGPKLTIYSFDRTAGALVMAISEPHAASFGFGRPECEAAQCVLQNGFHETDKTRWQVILGELPETLAQADALADVVFWDLYSTKTSPELWTVQTLSSLRAVCGPRATVHTYAAATSFRSGLLLAGFAVGFGPATGIKAQTTQAAVCLSDLPEPLDARWHQRLLRSSVPLPADAPEDAMATIASYFAKNVPSP